MATARTRNAAKTPATKATKAVFFCDGFALTRLSPPTRTKNKVLSDGGSSVDTKAPYGLVAAFGMPTKLFDEALAEQDVRVLDKDALLPGGLLLRSLPKQVSVVSRSSASTCAVPAAMHDLGVLALGPTREESDEWQTNIVATEDFAVALPDGERTVLFGVLDAVAPALTIHVRVVLPSCVGASRAMLPGLEEHVVAVFEHNKEQVHLAVLSKGGTQVHRVVSAVRLPVREGDTLVFQIDEQTIVRQKLDGTELERFSIPEEHRSVGQLVAQESVVYFLPDHGECILDLSNGKVIERKLSEEEKPIRAHFTQAFRRVHRAGRSAGFRVELVKVSIYKGRSRGFHPSVYVEGGDRGLLVTLLQGIAVHSHWWLGSLAGWNEGGWGHSGRMTTQMRTADLDETVQVLEILDANDLHMLYGWRELSNAVTDHLRAMRTRVAPVSNDAASLLLSVLLRSLSSPPPKQKPLVERWKSEGFSVEKAMPLLTSLQHIGSRGMFDANVYGIDVLVCALARMAWGKDALPLLEALVEKNPTPFANANPSSVRIHLDAVR